MKRYVQHHSFHRHRRRHAPTARGTGILPVSPGDAGPWEGHRQDACATPCLWLQGLILLATLAAQFPGAAFAGIYTGPTNAPAFNQLLSDVDAKRVELADTVADASRAGVSTDYAQVSQVTIGLFRDTFAPWDRANQVNVVAMYNAKWYMGQQDPVGPYGLPFDELADCIEVADAAIAELQQQIDGLVVLKDPPDFSTGPVALNGAHYERDGVRVIPSRFFWHPFEEDHMQAYGRMGEGYYALTDMQSSNVVKSWRYTSLLNSMSSRTAANSTPHQYFLGHTVGSGAWQRTAEPDAFNVGSRLFTHYDIDHPVVRPWLDQLFDKLLDDATGPSGSGTAPRLHMLANEPVFSIRQGGVDADEGVSSFTFDKFAAWLQGKYTTIGNLNATYGGTGHTTFLDAAQAYYTSGAGVSSASWQGGPIWYDWCMFNTDRVGDWFTYLHDAVRAVDPGEPTHLKIMGERSIYTDWHDEGIDFEFITRLVEAPGSDNQMTSLRAEYDTRGEQDWRNRYVLEWRSQAIMMDFMKSICPEKPFVDLEWHGLSGSRWRDFHMEPEYVRAGLWLATTHGLSAMNAWVWNRQHPGGAIDTRADFIGTTVTQPLQLDAFGRTMKELNAHGDDVTSLVPDERYYRVYYCRDSAIQDPGYSDDMTDVYEALKLLNVPVGFTTPTELASVSNATQTLIVPPTPFISDDDLADLQAFESNGGGMVLVTPSPASQNFRKDELGVTRSSPVFSSPNVVLKGVLDLADDLETALVSRKPELPVEVDIADSGGRPAYGVLSAQSYDPSRQRTVVWLINVSQDPRDVTLVRGGGTGSAITNLVTGQPAGLAHTMEPHDILLLSFTSTSCTSGPPPWITTYDFSGYDDGPLHGQGGWIGAHDVHGNVLALSEAGDWHMAWQTSGIDAVTYDEYTVSAVFSFSETGRFLNRKQFFNLMLNDQPANGTQFRMSLERADADHYAIRCYDDSVPDGLVHLTAFAVDLIGLDPGANEDLQSDILELGFTVTKGATEDDWAFTTFVDNLTTGSNVVSVTGAMSTQEALFTAPALYGCINGGQIVGAGVTDRVVYRTTLGGRSAAGTCPQPVLSIMRHGPNVDVSWDSETGAMYQLQTNAALRSSWSDYGAILAGNGTNQSVSIPTTAAELYIRAAME